MAVEAGREYNPETAQDLRKKDFAFAACGFEFRYTLEIPAYVLERLTPNHVMNRLYEYMANYATTVVDRALREGYFASPKGQARMRADVGQHLKNYIWIEFSKTQEKAGFDCWQTAPTLQEVQL